MARSSIIQRQLKREKLTRRLHVKRQELKSIIKDADASLEVKMSAQTKLQKMPRDSSFVRLHNRCSLTGRSRGYYRKFGLSRNKLRETAMRGDIPGLVKASW